MAPWELQQLQHGSHGCHGIELVNIGVFIPRLLLATRIIFLSLLMTSSKREQISPGRQKAAQSYAGKQQYPAEAGPDNGDHGFSFSCSDVMTDQSTKMVYYIYLVVERGNSRYLTLKKADTGRKHQALLSASVLAL